MLVVQLALHLAYTECIDLIEATRSDGGLGAADHHHLGFGVC